VRISHEEKDQLLRLIAEGENLDIDDLEALYRWIDDSHEALAFHPLQKQRFDEYCRLSPNSNFARTYMGVWILRFALEEASLQNSDRPNHIEFCRE